MTITLNGLSGITGSASNTPMNLGTGALTAGSGTFGNGTTNLGIIVNGLNSGTNGGSNIYVQNAGTTIAGLGNYSRMIGGAYDATATLFSSNTGLKVYVNGTGTIGTFSSSGLSVTGNVAISQSTSFPAVGLIHHTNNYLYLMGGTSGVINQVGATNITFVTAAGLAVTGSLSSTGNGIFGSGNANANIEAKSSVNTGGVGGSYVIFSAANAAARGYIEYAYATDKMTFATGGGSGSMVLDYSGNLGLGVSPSAYSGLTAGRLEVGAVGNSLFSNNSTNFFITNNTNYNNGFKFATATAASYYLQTTGAHKWYTSTTAPVIGNDPSFSNVMTLDASGNLLVAKTTADPTMGPNTKLQASVMGMGTVSGATTGAVDTGIPINAGESGGTIFLIANRNTSNGTSTDSAVYIVRLYYDGNNAPTTVYVGGSNNFVTFGVSGSQTLTVTNAGGGNATFSWIISS